MDFLSRIYSLNMRAKVYVVAFLLCSIYKTTSKISTALHKPLLFMYYLQPWLATITAVKYNPFYNEQFKKYLEDPSSTDVFDDEFKKHPLIPVLLALCIHIKFLSIERDTPLFPGCNPSWSFQSGKKVDVGSTLGTLGPEVNQSFSDKYLKPLSGEDLKPGSVHHVLPQRLKEVGFFVELHQNKIPTMDMGHFMRCLVLAIIIESAMPNLRAMTRDELESMRGPWNSGNWSVHSITSMLFPGIMQALKKECQYRCAHPVPERHLSNHSIIDKVYKEIGATTEPIDPTCLDYIFDGGAANALQGDAHAGAGMDEAEVNEGAGDIYEGEGMDDNYDAMDYAPDDLEAPVEVPVETPAEVPGDVPIEMPAEVPAQPGNEPLAGPSQRPNPVRITAGRPTAVRPTAVRPAAVRPTAVRPTSGPPNAEGERANAGFPITESTEPENDLPEAPTARKRNANEADIGPQGSSTPKRNRDAASDGSGIEVVLVAHVERPDANAAESERRNERQRSTFAGPQTGARGEGGAPHVRRAASQGPQQRVHRTGGGGLPPVQGRIAQETRETSARGSENAIATGDGDAGAIPRPVGSTGELGTEPPAAPENAGDDNAGAIPRPVASRPDNEQTDGGEEAQAETGANQKVHGYNKLFMCVFIAMIIYFYCLLSLAFEACKHPVNVTHRINCDAGIEVASSFCPEKKCVEDVKFHCDHKLDCKAKSSCGRFEDVLERSENAIIANYL